MFIGSQLLTITYKNSLSFMQRGGNDDATHRLEESKLYSQVLVFQFLAQKASCGQVRDASVNCCNNQNKK